MSERPQFLHLSEADTTSIQRAFFRVTEDLLENRVFWPDSATMVSVLRVLGFVGITDPGNGATAVRLDRHTAQLIEDEAKREEAMRAKAIKIAEELDVLHVTTLLELDSLDPLVGNTEYLARQGGFSGVTIAGLSWSVGYPSMHDAIFEDNAKEIVEQLIESLPLAYSVCDPRTLQVSQQRDHIRLFLPFREGLMRGKLEATCEAYQRIGINWDNPKDVEEDDINNDPFFE